MKGKFFVFEGGDASGKSIVSKLVSEQLSMNHLESPTSEYKTIRKYIEKNAAPFCRFLFYIASNLDLSRRVKEMTRSNDVICARYYFSTLIGYSYPLSATIEDLLERISLTHNDFYQPDLTILLYVNPSIQKRRICNRDGSDNDEADYRCLNDIQYANNIYEQYLSVAKKRNWVIIDTSEKSIKDVVKQSILEIRNLTNKNRCREADTLHSGVGQARSLDELDFLPY